MNNSHCSLKYSRLLRIIDRTLSRPRESSAILAVVSTSEESNPSLADAVKFWNAVSPAIQWSLNNRKRLTKTFDMKNVQIQYVFKESNAVRDRFDWLFHNTRINQSINQSINHSLNQSINQSTLRQLVTLSYIVKQFYLKLKNNPFKCSNFKMKTVSLSTIFKAVYPWIAGSTKGKNLLYEKPGILR